MHTSQRCRRLGPPVAALVLALATATGSALAHAYPKTTDPAPNARLACTW